MSVEVSKGEIATLRKAVDDANEMALLALQTAIEAVGAAAVALRSLEPKASTAAEQAVLGKAKTLLLNAERRVVDWTNS